MIKTFPQAIIFDWDNTLVDSWGAIAEALNITRHEFSLETWTLEQVVARCTRAARESFPEWFGPNLWQKAYDVYYQNFEKIRQRSGLHKMPGTDDLLIFLKNHKVPLFIVSNKRGDFLRQEVSSLKWDHFFVAVIGATDTLHDKPARDPVDKALSSAGLQANDSIWFIGDSETDVLCAQNAGCLPIYIGSSEKAPRLSIGASFSDCQHLQTLLNKYLDSKT